MVDWPIYLAPWINDIAPGSAQDFMYVVGAIEIVAGVSVALKPRYGAYIVAGWLAGIVINLLTASGFYDIALRDFGLMLAALTLARLASVYDPPLRRRHALSTPTREQVPPLSAPAQSIGAGRLGKPTRLTPRRTHRGTRRSRWADAAARIVPGSPERISTEDCRFSGTSGRAVASVCFARCSSSASNASCTLQPGISRAGPLDRLQTLNTARLPSGARARPLTRVQRCPPFERIDEPKQIRRNPSGLRRSRVARPPPARRTVQQTGAEIAPPSTRPMRPRWLGPTTIAAASGSIATSCRGAPPIIPGRM